MTDTEKVAALYKIFVEELMEIRDALAIRAFQEDRMTEQEINLLIGFDKILDVFEDPIPGLPNEVMDIINQVSKSSD